MTDMNLQKQLIQLRQSGQDPNAIAKRTQLTKEYNEGKSVVPDMLMFGAELGLPTASLGTPLMGAAAFGVGAGIGYVIGKQSQKAESYKETLKLENNPNYCTNLEESENICKKLDLKM